MDKYTVKLEGLTPLLMHFDNIEAQDAEQARGKSGGKAGDDRHPADRWKSYLYMSNRAVVMPCANLLSALLKQGSSISIGGKKTLKASTQALYFSDPNLRFESNGKEIKREDIEEIEGKFEQQRDAVRDLGFELQIAPARVNGKRHVRVRPQFNTWRIVADFETDDPDLTLPRMKQLFTLAGLKSGLGDWRPGSPSKPGPYGRFKAEVVAD